VKTLSESFGDDSPQIGFGDGSLLIYSHLYALPEGETIIPYPVMSGSRRGIGRRPTSGPNPKGLRSATILSNGM